MPDKVGSSPALRNEADPEHYHGEAFSPLAPWRSHAHRCQPPPFANESETARACQLCRWLSSSLEAAPQLASGAPETGASEQGGEEGGRL